MNYLICQDWINTSNNHAGIKYLCNNIAERFPEKYKSIVIPPFCNNFKMSKNPIIRRIQSKVCKYKHYKYTMFLYDILKNELHPHDKVIIMEYMDTSLSMLPFAKKLKKNMPQISLHVMAHLVPSKLDLYFPSNKDIKNWTEHVDMIYTLGHSLSNYFISRGVPPEKMFTTFHYVDYYYFNKNPVRNHERPTVIAMGNQMRNIDLLQKIVSENPSVDFIICQGVNDMRGYFANKKNVNLIPFVEESELRNYMNQADISLNVMKDTIGSNVIVTSLAMGLAMICSDVGSIRDYCNESNTLFCHNENISDFSKAITTLLNDRKMLADMQRKSYERATELTIERFIQSIESL